MADILKGVDKTVDDLKDKVISLPEIKASFDTIIKTVDDQKALVTALDENLKKRLLPEQKWSKNLYTLGFDYEDIIKGTVKTDLSQMDEKTIKVYQLCKDLELKKAGKDTHIEINGKVWPELISDKITYYQEQGIWLIAWTESLVYGSITNEITITTQFGTTKKSLKESTALIDNIASCKQLIIDERQIQFNNFLTTNQITPQEQETITLSTDGIISLSYANTELNLNLPYTIDISKGTAVNNDIITFIKESRVDIKTKKEAAEAVKKAADELKAKLLVLDDKFNKYNWLDGNQVSEEERTFLKSEYDEAEKDEPKKSLFLDLLDTKYHIEEKLKSFSDHPSQNPKIMLMMKCYYDIKNPENLVWLDPPIKDSNDHTGGESFAAGRFLLYGIDDLVDLGAKAGKLYSFFNNKNVNLGKHLNPAPTITESTILSNIDLYLAIAKWIDRPYWTGGSKYTSVDCINFVQSLYQEKELWGKKLNLIDWTHPPQDFPSLSQSQPWKVDPNKIPIWSPIGLRTGGHLYDDTGKNIVADVHHYWIYIGDGNFVHAYNYWSNICIDSLNTSSGAHKTEKDEHTAGDPELKYNMYGPFAYYYGMPAKKNTNEVPTTTTTAEVKTTTTTATTETAMK